jgi:phage FluMu gp28-like protein
VTVLDFLKDRLPAPISAQLDSAVEGGGLADAAKGLSGLLGKK